MPAVPEVGAVVPSALADAVVVAGVLGGGAVVPNAPDAGAVVGATVPDGLEGGAVVAGVLGDRVVVPRALGRRCLRSSCCSP